MIPPTSERIMIYVRQVALAGWCQRWQWWEHTWDWYLKQIPRQVSSRPFCLPAARILSKRSFPPYKNELGSGPTENPRIPLYFRIRTSSARTPIQTPCEQTCAGDRRDVHPLAPGAPLCARADRLNREQVQNQRQQHPIPLQVWPFSSLGLPYMLHLLQEEPRWNHCKDRRRYVTTLLQRRRLPHAGMSHTHMNTHKNTHVVRFFETRK